MKLTGPAYADRTRGGQFHPVWVVTSSGFGISDAFFDNELEAMVEWYKRSECGRTWLHLRRHRGGLWELIK